MANPMLTREWGREGVAPPVEATDRMEFAGVARKTGLLLAIVVAFGVWGWSLVDPAVGISWPGWLTAAILGAFVLAIVGVFRPQLARFLAPIYAAAQGVVLGAISRIYNASFDGIILQAVLATAVVFAVMLILYVTRTIRVTQRLRGVVIGATIGIAAFYLVSLLLMLFGVTVPLVWDTGWLGILFSAAVVVLAAFNLMLDFDLIERGIAAGAPRYMEWFAAWSLVITIVWLYLELLRLLAKLRD